MVSRRGRFVRRAAQVKSSHEIDQVMQAGKKNRIVGATAMNAGS